MERYVFWNIRLSCLDICTNYDRRKKLKDSILFYVLDNDILSRYPLKSHIAHIILSKEEQEFLKSISKNE